MWPRTCSGCSHAATILDISRWTARRRVAALAAGRERHLLLLGGTCFAHADQVSEWTFALGALAAASGASLLIGFLTPFGVVAGLVAIGLALWRPPPGTPVLLNGKLAALLVVVVAAAVGLLGPGALSLDARLFGRREIRIPRDRNRSPED